MNIDKDLQRHAGEFLRYLNNRQCEVSETGIVFPKAGAVARGCFVHDVNGFDERLDPNIVVTEGLTHMLSIVIAAGSQITNWFIAPFSGNVTPAGSWTAANFTTNSTEFTNYDEAARVAYNEGAASAGSINNLSNKAAFTISAGGGNVWGAALISNSAKAATTGVLMSASKFAAVRALVETDVLNIGYTLTLTSS